MKSSIIITSAVAGWLCLATPVSAHHSFPAHYQPDADIVLEGRVLEFLWRNPHSFIHLEVLNDSGEPEVWALEWHNTVMMARLGHSPDTIKPGDEIIVSGNPARDGTRRVRLVTLERPADNFSLTREGGVND
jgi:hypothetical protein